MESRFEIQVLSDRLDRELELTDGLLEKLMKTPAPLATIPDSMLEVDCEALHDLCLAADAAVITAQQIAAAAQAALDTQCAVRDALYNEYITHCDGM